LIRPEKARPDVGWRVRYVDPDTGRTVKRKLDPALKTREQREAYACKLADKLGRRRVALETGAVRATGTPIADAVERFYRAKPKLGERTVRDYRAATDKFLDWSKRTRAGTMDELTRGRLMTFREEIEREPKGNPKGCKRGRYKKTTKPRSEYSINRELRAVRTFLRWALDADLLPHVQESDLRRVFKLLTPPKQQPAFLKPHEAQKLLDAATRYDEDHPGEEVAAFAAALLLSGLRLGEAVELGWSAIDLDAVDASGKVAGEIEIRAEGNKTKRSRTVILSVSPGLRKLLAALKLRSGGQGRVFALDYQGSQAIMKTLRADYGAPTRFDWQSLRSSSCTFLVNAPGIPFDAWAAARQAGHSLQVSEEHYLGRFHGIDPGAQSLEEAMQIEDQLREITARVRLAQRGAA
jgi:integrase